MPPPAKVRGLVVDLDGVLRHFDGARTAAVEEAFDLPPGIIGATAFEPDRLRRVVTGAITDERWRYEVAVELAEMWGGDTAAAAVTAWTAVTGEIDPDVLGLVTRAGLRAPVVLLTNATTRLEADLTAAGVGAQFAAVVSSARTGFAKPDQRAFAAAEEALAAAAAARAPGSAPVVATGPIAYIDDDPGHVAAARERGWDAWCFTDATGMQAWLADRGLIVDGDEREEPARPVGLQTPGTAAMAGTAPGSRPPTTPAPWIRLAERPGLSAFVRATTVTFGLPDGTTTDWDLIHEPDAVAVLALTVEGRVLLARQYRPGPDAVLDELPGGLIDPGEAPADAAARELLEETGYAGQVEVLGWSWQDGRSTRRMWTAVATGCRRIGAPTPGPSEDIEIVLATPEAFLGQLRSGALTDAARAYRALDHLGLLVPAAAPRRSGARGGPA